MFPNREMAEKELEIAGKLNRGPWIEHSINVGLSAQMIAEKCSNLNPDKAYVLGLLHDIGRKYGISARRHGIDGYKFMMEKGIFPFTAERWNATFEMKEYFEQQMNCSIYDILPNVKETTFIEVPIWK
jgi:HD superfamily phosphodiesterase